MKRLFIFLLFSVLIAFAIFVAHKYSILSSYDKKGAHIENTPNDNDISPKQPEENRPDPTSETDKNNPTAEPGNDVPGSTAPEKTPEEDGTGAYKITIYDCENECKYINEKNELQYCLEYCGLSAYENPTGCDSLKNLEKDYCLKDLAINKKDFATCNQIRDKNIRTACENRITQDLIEN